MAQTVLTNCVVTLNSTVISSSVKAAKINFTPDRLDNTTFGMTAKSSKRGLKNWSVELELLDDFASACLDEGFHTLFSGDTTFTIILKPTTAIRGPSNPEYTGKGKFEDYSVGGAIGEMAAKTVRIGCAGASMARTTSAT